MSRAAGYIGIDVDKKSIAYACAEGGIRGVNAAVGRASDGGPDSALPSGLTSQAQTC